MRKTLQKGILIALCALLIIGVSAAFALNATQAPAPVTDAAQKHEPKYVFSQYKGRLALFQRDFAMPVEIFDVYLNAFPQEEQERILAGISAESDEEIQKIIEDYTS